MASPPKLNRRDFLVGSAGLLACNSALGALACGSPRDTSKMNVLLIVLEDTTASSLACFGNPIVKTPAIDAFAQTATVFDRAYCQASGCNASRSSFLTGLRPDATRVYGNRDRMDTLLPQGTSTLPELARTAGFRTAGLGKLFHHAYMAEEQLRAFDRLELCEKPKDYAGVSTGYVRPPDAEPLPAPRFFHSSNPETERTLNRLKAERDRIYARVDGGSTEWFRAGMQYRQLRSELIGDSGHIEEAEPDGQRSRLASQILGDFARSGERFFLSVGFEAPHTPLLAPLEYVDLYDPAKIPMPPAPPERDRGIPGAAIRFGRNFDLFALVDATPERVRTAIAAYYACVSFVDAQVRIVLDALEREGLADDTIVVFTADHGFHLGEHGLWGKVTLFEQSTRVPLIVRVPGATANGRRCGQIVELVDLVPTLCDLWKRQPPHKLEGTSFAPLLEQPGRDWKQGAFSISKLKPGILGRSVRTRRFRYAEWDAGLGVELYDLANDPWEQTNLIGDRRHARTAAEHARLLHGGWRAALPSPVG